MWRLGVEDLDAGGQVDVPRGDLTGAGDHQRRLDLGRVGVHPADDLLEVEDDVGHVLLDAGDRRELVGDPLDPDARDGRAGERGQQHAPQRVAERVAEAAIERLDRERAAVVLDLLGARSGESGTRAWVVSFGLVRSRLASGGRAAGFGLLLRVELDDELLLHRRGDLLPLRVAKHLRREPVVIGL